MLGVFGLDNNPKALRPTKQDKTSTFLAGLSENLHRRYQSAQALEYCLCAQNNLTILG